MIKKPFLVTVMVALSCTVLAQNLQVHYDLGDERKYLTTTIEMFRPDKLGSTFFFVDMDYDEKVSGVMGAYWEISRSFQIGKFPLQPRVEYNGGLGRVKDAPAIGYGVNSAYLAGFQYTINAPDFSKVLTLQANFKHIEKKSANDASWQLTAVWELHFFDRKLTFSGFADFWGEENLFDTETTKTIFLAEPQLWYNFASHFSVGSEVELSSNFAGNKGFMVNPTIAIKWLF
ncbi:MAG: DUF5020 family protein [Bacteroidales bacterium]|jgi:hypothetical protein|nr:DUF5020 family protein [Bacteroidales bacterium]